MKSMGHILLTRDPNAPLSNLHQHSATRHGTRHLTWDMPTAGIEAERIGQRGLKGGGMAAAMRLSFGPCISHRRTLTGVKRETPWDERGNNRARGNLPAIVIRSSSMQCPCPFKGTSPLKHRRTGDVTVRKADKIIWTIAELRVAKHVFLATVEADSALCM